MKRLSKFSLSTVLLMAFFCSMLFAQSQDFGVIQGKVTTPEGEPLPGVEVILTSPAIIGESVVTVTSDAGRFRFVALRPGVYAIEARLAGFAPQKREDVRVSVGITLTVDISLSIGTLEETVDVVGAAPTIDIKDSQIGTTTMSNEFLQQIPSGRSMRGQLGLAPGVHSESTFGSSESLANNFMIDGVKVNSPEAGEAEVHIDYDSIEEMSVMGLGAPAEYGGFTGAVVNTVTKSGGNNFSSLFTFFLTRPSWHSKNSDDPDLIYKRYSEEYDVHFNLGGPVMRDKLWFFTSGKYNYWKDHLDYEDWDNEWSEYGDEFRVMGKLTWQLNPSVRVAGYIEYNKDAIHNIEAGPFTSPEATPWENARQWYFNLSYLHIFSNTTFLEAKMGGYDQTGQINLSSDNPPRFDLESDYLSQNFWEYWEFPRRRIQLNAAVSHHADEFLAGSHDFKFGAEYERSPLRNARGYPGGKLYGDIGIYPDHEPYYMFVYEGYSAEPTTTRVSAFVQDSWTIGDRLTINAGIRWNRWRGALPSYDPDPAFAPKDGWAPRIGFTFDVLGDHTTAFKAHYGKYYHGLMGMFYLHLEPQGDYSEYVWGDVANMWAEEEYEETEEWPDWYPTDPNEYFLMGTDVWENRYIVDPDLRMPYMNQFVIGVERELMKDISVGATFIYRDNHDFIDRVNLTGEWEAVEWTTDITGETETFNVYKRLNPYENQFLQTNPNADVDYAAEWGAAYPGIVGFTPTRKYQGLELTFDKRYSNRWQLQVSYVYSKATGSDDNTWGEFSENRTSSLGASTKYSNPNWQVNAEGRLGIDPTHLLKVMGSYNIPMIETSIGFYLRYVTGNTYNRNILLDPSIDPDSVSWGDLLIYGEEKGSFRYPANLNLDLRLEKFFRWDRYRFGILIDMFNTLNSATTTSVEEEITPWSDYEFGYVWRIRRPRTWRFAFRFEF